MSRIHHMALLRFKPSATEEKVQALWKALAALKQNLPGIAYFAAGPYESPEGLNQGFTHGFLMTFVDALARDSYLVHPEHEKAKDEFLPFVENVVVFDFVE